jgi:hypothetical protein
MQDLRKEVEVRYEGCLQDDGDIGGVEQLDRVWVSLSSDALILQMKLNSEALEVDDDQDDNDGSYQVGYVRRILPIEGLLDGV